MAAGDSLDCFCNSCCTSAGLFEQNHPASQIITFYAHVPVKKIEIKARFVVKVDCPGSKQLCHPLPTIRGVFLVSEGWCNCRTGNQISFGKKFNKEKRNIPVTFLCDSSASQRVHGPVQLGPGILMRWWMAACRMTEALYPLVAANLRGNSSNVGPHPQKTLPGSGEDEWR